MDLLNFFLGAIGGGAVALGGAWWLGGKLIEHRLTKEIEHYKAGLTQKADILKTELTIYAHEQNIALSRIDAQRAKAIQDVYTALRAWVNPTSRIVAGSPYSDADEETDIRFYLENAEKAHDAGKKLADALANNAIYFDMETYATIAALSGNCTDTIAAFLLENRRVQAEGCPSPQLWQYVSNDRQIVVKAYNEKILPALQGLTERFRKALGVIREKAT